MTKFSNEAKKYILVDGIIKDEESYSVELNSRDEYAYEVIRLFDGTPLFLEDHIERLQSTLQHIGAHNSLTEDEARASFLKLCEANDRYYDNVKILIQNGHTYMKLAGASYPSEKMYREGATLGIISEVRLNPQVKTNNASLRELSDKIMEENDFAEVLLSNRENCITEGSRSNAFFIKDDVIYTCPPEGVLLGITRKKIVDLCKANGIRLEFSNIERAMLSDYGAVFISGTSPKVLPVRCIVDEQGGEKKKISFDVNNDCLKKIERLYDEEIERYITCSRNA